KEDQSAARGDGQVGQAVTIEVALGDAREALRGGGVYGHGCSKIARAVAEQETHVEAAVDIRNAVGDGQVDVAVVVKICRNDAHRTIARVKACTSREADRSLGRPGVEEDGHVVGERIGDDDVRQPVVVDIGHDHAAG